VKRRILLGTFALSSGYREAWYERAQRVRALLSRDFDEAFRACDAILCPTAPEPPFALGGKSSDPLAMYLADVFTVPPSLAGLPALSVPAGLSRDGLPIGMQLTGPAGSEPLLLALGRAVELGTGPGSRPPGAIR
jgi:aspartyl-tRNA(Asn)/glutamyl-tRNA(Gln) amidotransferase subunit A